MSDEVKPGYAHGRVDQVRQVLPDLSEEQSSAKRGATPDSDVDLLVVIPQSDLPPHRRDQMAYRAAGDHLLPLDILVVTHEEFERQRQGVSSLPATVLREGRVLYAA